MNETGTPGEELREGRLEDLIADLLSHKKYQEIVQRLFSRGKGEWVSVKELCAGSAGPVGMGECLHQLEGELLAVWLDYPGTSASEGQALLVFFYPESYRSKAAFYNRKTLAGMPAAGAETE
jgi:hypothetical protein